MQRPSLLRLIPWAALIFCAAVHAQQPAEQYTEQVAEQPDAISKLLRQPAVTSQINTEATDPYLRPQESASFSASILQPRTLDLITRPDDIWERIRNGFAVPNIDTDLVAQQQAWFLSHGEYLRRAISRSSRYLYHIVEELEKRGMPTELALLPFIESAYNPMAYSPAQASGMWQFIPSTGKDYNLKQNWWQDERRDVLASTDAALTYLQKIYEMHGDWHLALASYNWGEGAVKRAIEKNQAAGLPTDYLSLKMPDETRNYIPKLQAVKNIIANPELFGLNLPKVDNQPYFAAVNYSQGIDVMAAAKLAEMPVDEFKALNPSFNRPVIPGSANVTLLLPMDRVELFEANLESSRDALITWQAYTPRKGETLSKVAIRFGMDLKYLQQVNGLNPKTRLRPGTALLVQSHLKNDDFHQASINTMQGPVISYANPSPVKNAKSKKLIAAETKATAKPKSSDKRLVQSKTKTNLVKNNPVRKPASKLATLVKKTAS